MALVSLGCFLLVESPFQVGLAFRDCSAGIDALFDDSTNPSHADVMARIARLYSLRSQVWASLVGALVMGAVYVIGFNRSTLSAQAAAIIVAAFAGFLAGHCVYLVVVTGLFCHTLSTTRHLVLDWSAPLLTPGLQGCSEAIKLMGQLGSLLLTVLTAALVAQYAQDRSVTALVEAVVAIGCTLALLILIAVTSQYWLAKPGVRRKERVLRNLASEIGAFGAWNETVPDLAADHLQRLVHLLDIHHRVGESPQSYNDRNSLTAYLATVVGIVLQLLLAFAIAQPT